eukprot:611495-Alexandrium_andersonii.AAC.1
MELLRERASGVLSARGLSGVHGPTQRALLVRRTLAVLGVAVQADAVARRAVIRGQSDSLSSSEAMKYCSGS